VDSNSRGELSRTPHQLSPAVVFVEDAPAATMSDARRVGGTSAGAKEGAESKEAIECAPKMPTSYGSVFSDHQAKLPRLRIPELASTCEKLLEWAAPLLTPAEAAASKAAVDEFLADPAQV
jgi:hypothetical protein